MFVSKIQMMVDTLVNSVGRSVVNRRAIAHNFAEVDFAAGRVLLGMVAMDIWATMNIMFVSKIQMMVDTLVNSVGRSVVNRRAIAHNFAEVDFAAGRVLLVMVAMAIWAAKNIMFVSKAILAIS